ncbi:MAG: carboxypeptidase regulatory-like domain-containing protein [Alphaproteobacteria bacterium]|nr:carboxypeptidase regulatory-like domain-containing protein [Alphaproteobacteria bacterium]
MRGCRTAARRLLAPGAALAALLVLGCLGLYGWIVTPTSAPYTPAPAPTPTPLAASGQVVFEDGAPAPGVTVAGTFRGTAAGLRVTRTDAEGRFSLALPGPGTVAVLSAFARPPREAVDQSRDDLRFVVPPLCDLELTVRVDPQATAPRLIAGLPEGPDLEPLAGARIRMLPQIQQILPEGPEEELPGGQTDAEGLWRAEGVPCDRLPLELTAEGWASPALWSLRLDGEPAWTAILAPAALLDGVVQDTDGAPLSGALIAIDGGEGAFALTDREGRYARWVVPTGVKAVTASAEGYLEERRPLTLAPDSAGATLDFALAPLNEVTVYCAGLPGESCDGVSPLFCTRPLVMIGEQCGFLEPITCRCPGEGAVVRGGGKAVQVAPDQREVWLDFTRDGGITGTLVGADGAPAEGCVVAAVRAPTALLEDAGRGLILERNTLCDDEGGAFTLQGLIEGTWRLELRGDGKRRILPEVDVRPGQLTDVGAVRLDGGGRIDGVVLDGLTGEPMRDVPVALGLDGDPLLSMPVHGDRSDDEGRFGFEGLEPDDYRVFALTDPFSEQAVPLSEGAEVALVLEIGDNRSLAEAGLTLYTGGAGELIIGAVTEDSPASALGLQEGDVVLGVEFMGMDAATLHPRLGRALLSRYGGPGMTLVVDRGGRQVVVDL